MSILFRLHAKAINQFVNSPQATAPQPRQPESDIPDHPPATLLNLDDYRYTEVVDDQNQLKNQPPEAYFDASTTTMIGKYR